MMPIQIIIKLIVAVAWEEIKLNFAKDDVRDCSFSNYSFRGISACIKASNKLALTNFGLY